MWVPAWLWEAGPRKAAGWEFVWELAGVEEWVLGWASPDKQPEEPAGSEAR